MGRKSKVPYELKIHNILQKLKHSVVNANNLIAT